jgi:signal transduction histidine kinase
VDILIKADKLKSEFLAQMSHEIRSPISVILSFTNLIQCEVQNFIDPELKEGFKSIKNAGSRIIRTIDMILNMSEIQTGTYEYSPKLLNLYDDVFEILIPEYRQIAKEKGLILNFTKTDEIPKMMLDEFTINQIFANLLDNAIKYSQQGEINIVLSSANMNNITVSIEDTGIGISQEYLPHLFGAFTQEEQGYKRRFEGNGLGLALVKKYCELNNAEISVNSQKGKGSKFVVMFRNTIK